MMFTPKQCEKLKENKIPLERASKQVKQLQSDIFYLDINRFCDVEDGVHCLKNIDSFISKAKEAQQHLNISTFVPASGAASRMFAELFEYIENGNETKNITYFFDNVSKFAFYDDLAPVQQKNLHEIVRFLLLQEGLDYANLPKALLKFHKYPEYSRIALEEHLVEAAQYAQSKGKCILHFTISPEHRNFFLNVIKNLSMWEEKLCCKLDVTISEQGIATQSLSLDENNAIFKSENGEMLLRPGGHGSLIHNLNELSSDVVFIKNIDNVSHDDHKKDTLLWKKILLGFFYEIQNKSFYYLNTMTKPHFNDNSLVVEAKNFIEKTFYIKFPFASTEDIVDFLNRPLRVCGIVANTGEPGGGPFWVVGKDGKVRCQIVEKNQIDITNPTQKKILLESKFFNPVDLVCGLKNFRNEKFDLTKYINEDTYIIVNKSYQGRKLKSIELPGLWNGGMYYWNTVFVKVPITTFNPVKTVFDLLRKEHQCSNT